VLDVVANAMCTKVAASQPDMLSAPSRAFLRALVDKLQADGLVKLSQHADKLENMLLINDDDFL
jgi:hypothetical protein